MLNGATQGAIDVVSVRKIIPLKAFILKRYLFVSK